MELSRFFNTGRVLVAPVAAIGILAILPESGRAQTAPDALTAADLQRQLDQRDAIIADLLRRVLELEARVGAGGAAPASAVPAALGEPAEWAESEPEPEGAVLAQGDTPPPSAPGTFEVDEEAATRALERTLVREGALLLPFGALEVEPSLSYIRDERDTPTVVNGFVGEEEFRRNTVDAEVDLRFGLPFDSQLEIEIPYSFIEDETVTSVGFAEIDEESESNTGFGDIELGFTKTLLRESGWRPDLFGNVNWNTRTGGGNDGVGTGFHELQGTLTAVKRIDPLVWVGGVSYQYAFEHDDIQPGPEIGLSLGTVLAVSPETSLRFFLLQTFADKVEAFDDEIPGSDQVASSFEFGVSSVLSPRVLFDLSAEIGVTEDAPDFQIELSLPIRFNLPFL
ncbi:MAG TPA: transporter [Ferrovibrio sp.]|uniref:transporter n=1 Tax=Ferrovibrio sp. TaxID=1917215 RepID=UPI002ED4D906